MKRILVVALLSALHLAGCLPESKDTTSVSNAGQLGASNYAASLGSTAVLIQGMVVSDSSWVTSSSGVKLDLAAMGIDTKSSGATINSGVCPTTDNKKALQVSWLTGEGDGKALKLSGEDSGSVTKELRKRLPPEQVGHYTGGRLIKMASGGMIAIPESCQNKFEIPAGSPVVVFEMEKPASVNVASSKIEYRSVPCPDDQVGAIVQKRTVQYGSNGVRVTPEADWEVDVSNCQKVDSVEVVVNTIKKGAAADYKDLSQQSSISSVIKEELGDMDCTSVSTTQGNTSGRISQTDAMNNCQSVSVPGSAISTTSETDEEHVTVVRRLPCAGVPEAGPIKLGAFGGAYATYSKWSGQAQVKRKYSYYSVTDTDGRTQSAKKRATWEVISPLACNRTDTAVLNCGDIKPAAESQAGKMTPISSDRLVYKRSLRIDGFKDLSRLIPNELRVGDWRLESGSCQWLEEEKFSGNCAADELSFDGERKRTVTASAFTTGGFTRSSWEEVTPAECVYYNPACSGRKPIVSFVIDQSGSIGAANYELVRQFFTAFINQMDYVGDEPANIVFFNQNVFSTPFETLSSVAQSVLTESFTAEVTEVSNAKNDAEKTKARKKHLAKREKLRSDDKTYVHPILTVMQNTKYRTGGTAIGEGIIRSVADLNAKAAALGDPTQERLLVLFTDGQNTHGRSVSEAVKLVEASGIKTFVIGVGTGIRDRDLLPVANAGLRAGEPAGSNYEKLSNFKDFAAHFRKLSTGICKIVGASGGN